MTGVLLLYLFLIVLIRRILLVPVCLRIVVELVILACLRVMCLVFVFVYVGLCY